jgi:PKD repeat protein
MYVGLENKVYKSTNGGLSFDVIYTFPSVDGIIYEMEISRSNPDVIYCVYNEDGGYWDPCKVWKSEDGGVTWNQTISDPSGNNRRFRISVHPEDENNIWLCTARGVNDHLVFNSINGGDSWINKTTSTLDDKNVSDIMYQGGTNDIVYITTQNGVLYWDANSNDWIEYSTDLPLIAKSFQMNPFYRDAELRLGTNGRGVWGREMVDTSFMPIAQPITYDKEVRCLTEPVQFDCYSMLKHDGATWEWSISPDPLSISSTTVRNPVVVFGIEGNYDVSLTVTDAQGNSDTKTIANMVTVLDDCPNCISYGNMSYATAVTLVDFNEIYNPTGKTNPYTDYSDDFSTTLETGSSHDLSVHVNPDGNYTVYAKAWIDWNQDLDFDDPNEEYDLGLAANTPDGPTSLSPLNITVPQDALAGATTLRVSGKYNGYPTSCETDFDGEVEDYEIIVMPTLGIIENTFGTEPIIYPNPTNGKFSIDMRAIYQSLRVIVKDINGRLIQSNTYSESQLLNLNIEESTGVYFVVVASKANKAVLRIIKE